MKYTVKPIKKIAGMLQVPGDKSISHRSIMLGSIANGTTEIEGFLQANDCLSTIRIFKQLGVQIKQTDHQGYLIKGNGLASLQEPNQLLDVGNSGTTIRLITGILAGQHFHSVIAGDHSIAKRPMGRVVKPLKLMGATIDGRENGSYAPLSIRGGELKGIHYESPVASAQIKSALLFAGLYGEGKTTVKEPFLSRDHTEKMLLHFGAELEIKANEASIVPRPNLEGQKVLIPGDFSSAAFFIAAALIVPNSKLLLKRVGYNPTRTGFLDAVIAMNGKVEIVDSYTYGLEPVADIMIESSELKGIKVNGEMIPRIIDELPLLAVLASQAEGTTEVTDAKELRVKETDRIKTIVSELRKIGLDIDELEDGFVISGKQVVRGGFVTTHGDHRIGMAIAIAGLIAKEEITIDEIEAVNISYPNYFEDLGRISKY